MSNINKSRLFFPFLTIILVFCIQNLPAGNQTIETEEPDTAAYRNIRQLPAGHDYHTLRGSIANSGKLFRTNTRSRVAFLGGSITHNPGWRDQVCQYLEAKFPETEFDFINAGIPSMGSTPGAFRFRRDVLSRGPVDLLFVEAAVNDSTNERSDTEQVRAMEGIVRQARDANPAMDLIFMYFADPDKTGAYDRGRIPDVIKNHEKVAEYYSISALNLALEVAERIKAGQFSWQDDFRDLHPSEFGQDLYAESIKRMLDKAWEHRGSRDLSVINHAMPETLLDRECYGNGRLADISEAEIITGWKIIESWTPPDSASTREGFVNVPALEGTQPGARLRFRFRGSAVGIFVAAGPDAGIIEYSIDGGTSQMRDLFTRWSSRLHLPWAHVLETGLDASKEHLLELTIAEATNPESRGNAARIFHFLVN